MYTQDKDKLERSMYTFVYIIYTFKNLKWAQSKHLDMTTTFKWGDGLRQTR